MSGKTTASSDTANAQREGNVVHLSGQIDQHHVPMLVKQSLAFTHQDQYPDEVNLSAVKHIDSAGLAMLLEWQSWAIRNDINLRLTHAPRQLRMLVKLSDLDDVLGLE